MTWDKNKYKDFKIIKLKRRGPKDGQSVDAYVYGKTKGNENLINNPKKLKALEAMGVKINQRVPLSSNTNKYNEKYISTKIKKPNQIIQPYQFGHDVSKKTCLWLKNLPNLIPTKIVKPDIIEKDGYKMSRHHWETFRLPSKIRGKVRSRFYEGIAEAMANQWG